MLRMALRLIPVLDVANWGGDRGRAKDSFFLYGSYSGITNFES